VQDLAAVVADLDRQLVAAGRLKEAAGVAIVIDRQ
jgi:hypothetical protein